MPRSRLDAALVERGLVASRARAQAMVASGRVRVDGAVTVRPAAPVDDGATLVVDPGPAFVSRGGEKLARALDDFGLDVQGVRALDLGASTGGFTDCLLQRGAESVAAVDVGYGQLAWSLRNDPRVAVLERTNARSLTPELLHGTVDFVTCDLAFIGVEVVWPAVAACVEPDHRSLVLVKPQFEVGRGQVGSGGVVRDPELHRQAIERVARAVSGQGHHVLDVVPSRLLGPRGNREFFLLTSGRPASKPVELERRVAAAIGAAS